MKILHYDCPGSVEETIQVIPGPGNGTLMINRVKKEDYYIEFIRTDGRIIISCNFPNYMQSKQFDLSKYSDNEYTLRVSNRDSEWVCLYRVFKY